MWEDGWSEIAFTGGLLSCAVCVQQCWPEDGSGVCSTAAAGSPWRLPWAAAT